MREPAFLLFLQTRFNYFNFWSYLLLTNYYLWVYLSLLLAYSYIFMKFFTINVLLIFKLIFVVMNVYTFFIDNAYITDFINFDNFMLLNYYVLIHPVLLFIGWYFLSIMLYRVLYLNKQSYNKIYYTNWYIIYILLSALLLGGFWAQDEGTWGGFWAWDYSECLSLNFILYYIFYVHYTRYINYTYITCLMYFIYSNVVIYTYLYTKFFFIISSHNFDNLFHIYINFNFIILFLITNIINNKNILWAQYITCRLNLPSLLVWGAYSIIFIYWFIYLNTSWVDWVGMFLVWINLFLILYFICLTKFFINLYVIYMYNFVKIFYLYCCIFFYHPKFILYHCLFVIILLFTSNSIFDCCAMVNYFTTPPIVLHYPFINFVAILVTDGVFSWDVLIYKISLVSILIIYSLQITFILCYASTNLLIINILEVWNISYLVIQVLNNTIDLYYDNFLWLLLMCFNLIITVTHTIAKYNWLYIYSYNTIYLFRYFNFFFVKHWLLLYNLIYDLRKTKVFNFNALRFSCYIFWKYITVKRFFYHLSIKTEPLNLLRYHLIYFFICNIYSNTYSFLYTQSNLKLIPSLFIFFSIFNSTYFYNAILYK